MRSHYCVFIFLGIFTTVPSLLGRECFAQLRPYSVWDKDARDQYQELSHAEFLKNGNAILESLSDSTLVTILSRREFPVLRLAAYGALRERLPQLQPNYLVMLLAHAESLSLYDAEFCELEAITEEISIQALCRVVDVCSIGNDSVNIRVILKAIPRKVLIELLEASSREPIGAPGLALIIGEICSRKPNWKETADHEIILENLKQLKLAPGPAQLTYVSLFPFQHEEDALPHLACLLDDEGLEVPPVLIAVSKFKELLAASREELIAMVTNKALVMERLGELSKRFSRRTTVTWIL